MVTDLFLIRFAVCSKYASEDDMHIAFQIIQTHTDGILFDYEKSQHPLTSVQQP